MKENSIEEDIAKVNTYIELVLEKDYCNCNELNTILGKHCDGSKNVAYAIEHILSDYKRVLKENEELRADNYELNNRITDLLENIPIQKVKDIIDRIDYDIKKTKEIISKNTNIYASYRKNDYQIVRLRAMNTKSLDIKNRLQKLLESEE